MLTALKYSFKIPTRKLIELSGRTCTKLYFNDNCSRYDLIDEYNIMSVIIFKSNRDECKIIYFYQ